MTRTETNCSKLPDKTGETEDKSMRTLCTLLVAALIGLQSCTFLKSQTGGSTKPEGFGESRASDLTMKFAQDTIAAEWGITTEIPIDITWAAEQKYAVQLAPAANTPRWLGAELQPSIVDPPGRTVLKISPVVGDAQMGATELVIEGSAFGLSQPAQAKIIVLVRRQGGDFAPLLAAPVTVECRNICGKVDKRGQLAFYDILREKNQTCSDKDALPETQRIGSNVFALSDKGFGYGRTCRLAGVFDAAGMLTFVNLGIYSAVPRGGMLLGLRGVVGCWLSPDNTIALIRFKDLTAPYDVLTGVILGQPCRTSENPTSAFLSGMTLTSGTCSWEIK
jgi:hypothetical protein